MKLPRIGAHTPTSGGMAKRSLGYAETIQAEAIQVFTSNPRGWATPEPNPAADEEFRTKAAAMDIATYVHAPFLINLGSPTEGTYKNSLNSTSYSLRRGKDIGALGVVALTIDFGRLPWIALALATSWGSYGLIKKRLNLGALEGLAIETLISFIPYSGYLIYLASHSEGQWGQKTGLTLLLTAAGAITAIPLLLFNGAATRLPYSTLGLLQYITPTLQFSIGVWIRHESMPTGRWIGFIIIWFALVALAFDLVKSTNSVNN